MGEIADDMACGLCCSECGVYFEEEHGYPVLCNSCWVSQGGNPRDRRVRVIIDGCQRNIHMEA